MTAETSLQQGPTENRNAFAQHREQDATLRNQEEAAARQSMSFVARTLTYIGFPLLVGIAGLYVGYIQTLENPKTKVDFDRDFLVPFVLALALVVVISIQTKAFTKKEITPLIQRPTVRRKKKIIRKRIIVDDDGNEIKEEGKTD